jgi:hypothetical protein
VSVLACPHRISTQDVAGTILGGILICSELVTEIQLRADAAGGVESL